MSEFGYTTEQANYELDNHADEVLIHLKIWNLVSQRQEDDARMQEIRSQAGGNVR